MAPVTGSALITSALVVLALATGCASGAAGPPAAEGALAAPPEAAPEAVAWVDTVCGALLPFVQAAGTPPQLTQAADPTALVRGVSDYLAHAQNAADSAISGLAAAGPSPVAGGDEVVSRLTENLTAFRTTFQDARARLDAVDPADPQSLASELPMAVAPLQELANLPNATAGLQSSPELDRASAQAPNCREVQGVIGT
jgi:hypothetical protein